MSLVKEGQAFGLWVTHNAPLAPDLILPCSPVSPIHGGMLAGLAGGRVHCFSIQLHPATPEVLHAGVKKSLEYACVCTTSSLTFSEEKRETCFY